MKTEHRKKLKFFDFCAGIGAGHSALHNLGWKCVGFSEINKKSEKTYHLLNNSNGLKNYGDLMKISSLELPDFDLAIGGFPCQSFSIVGKRKGMEDERGQIIYGIVKILKEKAIKYFILENVKGLVNHDKGNTLKVILALLDEAGYIVEWKVLKSSDFGMPQIRERIYLVGRRKDLLGNIIFPNKLNFIRKPLSKILINTDSKFIFQEGNKGWNTFMKYLSNKYNKGKFDLNEIVKSDFSILDTRQSDLRIYKDDCPTLRTGRHGILYVRNGKLRKLSGIEGLLLQGFKLNQVKNVSDIPDNDLLSQAGNAFTVNVIEEIALCNFNN